MNSNVISKVARKGPTTNDHLVEPQSGPPITTGLGIEPHHADLNYTELNYSELTYAESYSSFWAITLMY